MTWIHLEDTLIRYFGFVGFIMKKRIKNVINDYELLTNKLERVYCMKYTRMYKTDTAEDKWALSWKESYTKIFN